MFMAGVSPMLALLLCLSAALVSAVPVAIRQHESVDMSKRDVVAPPITSPDASTVWTVGQTTTVTWETSMLPPPANITNIMGTIYLGYIADGEDGEHLMTDSPLAKGFNITSGSVDITVPNVADRSDYIIVLFGDSGNISPQFTINGGSSSSAASSTASSSADSASSSSAPSTAGTTTESDISKPTETAVPPTPTSSSISGSSTTTIPATSTITLSSMSSPLSSAAESVTSSLASTVSTAGASASTSGGAARKSASSLYVTTLAVVMAWVAVMI